MSQTTNHLRDSVSPYLLQHAQQPVDWYPWCPEALNKAKLENKPILLSIGYAACHWCHVMAHESFDDLDTAAVMNQLFVNIKVDREERPDLDKIYQTTHYLLTQRNGGWPLTVFLTPDDLTPFFSGTYFPAESKYQLPAFKEVLQRIAQSYAERHTEIKKQNQELQRILNPLPPIISDVRLNAQPIEHALQALRGKYDKVHGGFGGAPKFPQSPRLDFLFSHDAGLVEHCLQHIAYSGLSDQLGGGFYRYTVDANWRIPHFEKMLYDNAQLLHLYSVAWQRSQHPLLKEQIVACADWVNANLQDPAGGYYSSYDADSEGHEGKFYVWHRDEIQALLTAQEFAVISLHFGLNQPANFEQQWHFYIETPIEIIASTLDLSIPDVTACITSAKLKLQEYRAKRTPPACDTKILLAWNALMIKAMLTAGRVLAEPRYIDSAQRALQNILDQRWRNKRFTGHVYLDDYAFLLDALITALENEWDSEKLKLAIELAETMLTHYMDKANGGFYFTADDHEQVLYRPKTMMDEATPSGNGVAAKALFILGHLIGEQRYITAAEKTIHAAWPLLTHYPDEHCSLLTALQLSFAPPQLIVIRGLSNEVKEWQTICKHNTNLVFAIPNTVTDLPEILGAKKYTDKPIAYICQGTQCLESITDIDRLKVLTQ